MKSKDIYTHFKGKFVTGQFTKKNGDERKFWGKLEYDARHPKAVTFFDQHKRSYRRFSLNTATVTITSAKATLTIAR